MGRDQLRVIVLDGKVTFKWALKLNREDVRRFIARHDQYLGLYISNLEGDW
jgi:hypothetical protein